MARVLITRAQPQARLTAQRVAALGHTPLVMPLVETEPQSAAIATLRDAPPPAEALMVATSARALDVLLDAGLESWIAQQRWAVVGDRAGAKLAALGAQLQAAPAPDAKSLAQQLIPIAAPMLYLAAADRKPDLELAMPKLQTLEVYRSMPVGGFSHDQVAQLGADPIDAVLIYSARSASLLGQALEASDLLGAARSWTYVCLSDAVARAVEASALSHVPTHIAASPDEDALLLGLQACLSSQLQGRP